MNASGIPNSSRQCPDAWSLFRYTWKCTMDKLAAEGDGSQSILDTDIADGIKEVFNVGNADTDDNDDCIVTKADIAKWRHWDMKKDLGLLEEDIYGRVFYAHPDVAQYVYTVMKTYNVFARLDASMDEIRARPDRAELRDRPPKRRHQEVRDMIRRVNRRLVLEDNVERVERSDPETHGYCEWTVVQTFLRGRVTTDWVELKITHPGFQPDKDLVVGLPKGTSYRIMGPNDTESVSLYEQPQYAAWKQFKDDSVEKYESVRSLPQYDKGSGGMKQIIYTLVLFDWFKQGQTDANIGGNVWKYDQKVPENSPDGTPPKGIAGSFMGANEIASYLKRNVPFSHVRDGRTASPAASAEQIAQQQPQQPPVVGVAI